VLWTGGSSLWLWDTNKGELLDRYKEPIGGFGKVLMSPDDRTVIAGAANGFYLLEIERGKLPRKQGKKENLKKTLQDGQWVVQPTKHFFGHPDKQEIQFESLAFSPDGKWIYAGGVGRTLSWDVDSRTLLPGAPLIPSVPGTERVPRTGQVLFSPDDPSRALLYAQLKVQQGSPPKMQIFHFNRLQGSLISSFGGYNGVITMMAYTRDGRHLLSCSQDGTLVLWDAHAGKEIRRLEGVQRDVSSIAFSPEGRRVVVASTNDNAFHMWDVETGKKTHRFEGHTDRVTSLAYYSNGAYIASGSLDKSVRFWTAPK
jgi:WD40 repeat protein